MADPQTVTEVYKWVIEDVITKLMPEFENSGIPDSVITMIHQIWNAKMRDTMAAQQSQMQAQIQGLQLDRAVASLLQRPQTDVFPLMVNSQISGSMIEKSELMPGRSISLLPIVSPSMTPSAVSSPSPELNQLLNNSTCLHTSCSSQSRSGATKVEVDKSTDPLQYTVKNGELAIVHPMIPVGGLQQPTSSPDNHTPNSNITNSGMATTSIDGSATKKVNFDELDDSDQEYDDRRADTSSWENLAFCLFEKCRKVKTKRKFVLSGGVMYLNGRDYLFKAAEGEFQLQL